MRWKKILIAASLLIIALIVGIYAFLALYDFNKSKSMIARVVKDATGRELIIAGNIDFDLGIRPTLVVEDVSFQNAPWSSRPSLARVKRLEAQIAVLPLMMGNFDFIRLVLIEPDVIVEFDGTGTSNFSFDTRGETKEGAEIPPPPLIFSDVYIERGLFTYQDAQSDLKFSIRIDRLKAEIPGFDKSLEAVFEGAFNDIPFTLNGTVGPIWAWVEPGYALPANLALAAGGATTKINGEIRDPVNFKDLAFTISAEGPSTADIAKLAGMNAVPEFGGFRLMAKVADPQGAIAAETLDVRVGSEELAEIFLDGTIKDLLVFQGIKLNFTARGKNLANLTKLGMPPPPRQGPFRISAKITDSESQVYAAKDLNVVLDENEITGQVNLNLAKQVPILTVQLAAQKFELGPSNLDLILAGPVEKPAIKKLDLKLGTPELAEIRLHGIVGDLMELQGVDINFQARGKDLANLKQLTGRPLPIRGAFSTAGKVLIPVHKNLKIPDLKIAVGKNDIRGSLDLDLRSDKPQLAAVLSSPKLELPSVLLPQLAAQPWAKGLSSIGPVKLVTRLAGFFHEFGVKELDLQAGTYETMELRLTGSIENLPAQQGIDLDFQVRGKEMETLYDIAGQPSFFSPVPGRGAYVISGNVIDPKDNDLKINDLKFVSTGNELAGWLDLNLAAQPPRYEVKLSARQFNLKSFAFPKGAAYAKLAEIDNLGSLKLHSKVIIEGDRLSLPHLDIEVSNEQLASMEVRGAIQDLTDRRGIDLDFVIRGNEVANLAKLTDQSIPLQGSFAISGKLTDLAQKNYNVDNLALKLGENNIAGRLSLDLSDKQLQLAADLSAPKFTLRPVTLPAIEPLTRIEDLGPLKMIVNLAGFGDKLALEKLDLQLGSEQLTEVILKGAIKDLSAMRGMKLDFTLRGRDLASIQKLGGPPVPFQGAFNVSGQFFDPAPKIYKIPSLNAVWGDNDRKGWIELDLSKKRPQLKAELSSLRFDLRTLIANSEQESAPRDRFSEPDKKIDRIFSSEPIHFEGLMKIDADIKLRDKKVLLPNFALDDVQVDILLKNGNLQLKPFRFMVGGGKADVQFDLRSQDKPPRLAVAKVIDQLDLGPMLDELGYPRNIEGRLNTDVALTGQGGSMAELMAGLNGNIYITMSDGRAASEYLNLLQKYLGSDILQVLNPFQNKAKYEQINCFVNNIEIEDGLADVRVLLDTQQTSILAAGDVNLKTEKLNMGIKPTPKKGHGIKGVGTFSFSLKELSQPFRLGGTLAKPSLVVDPSRTAFTLGKFAGALALGPVGIAAFFADVSIGKKDPCQIALQAIKNKKQAVDEKKADQTTAETATSGEKKKEKKSGGFFKRLFGQ
jgi:uncharacterized protein involved in outer membrane biogenesis